MSAGKPASRAQCGQIRTALKHRDLAGGDAAAAISTIIGRPITQPDDLTRQEAQRVIDELRSQAALAAPLDACAHDQRVDIKAELERLRMGRDQALAFYTSVTGRPVAATADLTVTEAREVLKALRATAGTITSGQPGPDEFGQLFPEGDQQ
jgi:hypothetical protein